MRTVEAAAIAASGGAGSLVHVGVRPDNADTAYGYLEINGGTVGKFIEKPNRKLAGKFLKSGKHFWNSGIFCCPIGHLIKLLEKHCGELIRQCREIISAAAMTSGEGENLIWLDERAMNKLPAGSIDYMLMEKMTHCQFVEAEMDWRDVGSLDSYGDLFEKDKAGNMAGEMAFAEDSFNCFAYTAGRPVTMLGLKDVIIVDTGDQIFVTKKNQSKNLKNARLKFIRKSPEKTKSMTRESRPWGHYKILAEHDLYKVKKLVIDPHASLSLQSHQFRSEHWVVVEGRAQVTLDGKTMLLWSNDAVRIPAGAKHRIVNPFDQRVVIIETQTGTYLGEDDVITHPLAECDIF